MKKYISLLLLLLIPILTVIVASYYRLLEIPISHLDPNYQYFCNITNTAELKSIGTIFFHPGTTVHIIGAIISKILYSVRSFCPEFSNLSFAEDALLHPEIYIDVIKTTINFLTYFLLIFAGIFTWRISKSLLAGILMQLTPIIEPYLFLNCIGILEPILLLLPGFILLAICIISVVNDADGKKIKLNAVCFGVVVAFLVASRLNAAPVAIIPLILIPKIKNKLIFICSATISGLIFLAPVFGCYKSFFQWIIKILSHSGRYGGSKEIFFNSDAFFANLKWVLNDKILLFSFVIAVLILLHFALLKILGKKSSNSIHAKALFAVIIAQLFIVFSVLRHRNYLTGYSEIWLYPAQLLVCSTLALIVLNINVLFASKLWLKRTVQCLLIIVIISTFGKSQVKGLYRRYQAVAEKDLISKRILTEDIIKLHYALNTKLKNDFNNYSKITYNAYYSIPYNLYCGNLFAAQKQTPVLRKLYPDYYWYNKNVGRFYWWGDPPISFDQIYEKNPKIVFQGADLKKIKHNIGLPLVKVLDSDEDVLYILKNEFHLEKLQKALDDNLKNINFEYIIKILQAIKENKYQGVSFDDNITNNLSENLGFFINAINQKNNLSELRKIISNFEKNVDDNNKIVFDYVLRNFAPKSWQKEFNVELEYCLINLKNILFNKEKSKIVQIYNLPLLNQPRTIKFRVKPRDLSGTLIYYGKKSSNALCAIAFKPDKKLFFWGYYNDLGGNASLTLNKWSDICLTFDGETATLYLNNQEISNGKLKLETGKTDKIIIGEGFNGEIDDLEIWNKALPMKNIRKSNPGNIKRKNNSEKINESL